MTEFVQLEDVIESAQSGFASGARAADGVVQLRMNNVTTDGNLDWSSFIRVPATEKEIAKYSLEPGDVLFNATNSPNLVGKTAFFNGHTESVVFSNHFVRLRADLAQLEARYLARWLTYQWQRKTFESLCTQWVNQATVRKEDLLLLKIPLPPLSEQRRIAALLDKADKLRRTRRYAAQLSETFLQAVFVRMFGNPVKNEMGWELSGLEELGFLGRGMSKNRPRNAPELYGGKYPFVQTGDITNSGGYIRSYKQTYSELGLRQSKMWQKGTLCITIAANIGKTGILMFDSCFPDSVVGFVANEKTNVEFIQHWFSFMQKGLEELAPESAQKNIDLEILRELAVIAPPLALQEKFARIVQQFERLRAQQREAERQAEHLFQTLLKRAFE